MKKRRSTIFMLGILSVMTPFSIDMYLPAFPEIARDLTTTLARVSFSVSTYFVGFALGQIFYGIMACVGIGGPNSSAVAMAPFSKNAGSASALLGFVQIGLGSVISSCVGMTEQKGVLPTAAVMSASTVAGLAILLMGRPRIGATVAADPSAPELLM